MARILPSGHVYEELEGEEFDELKKKYTIFGDGVIVANPGNFIFPKSFLRFADRLYNFEIKETDIFVVTFAKSGTNWMQEIVWSLVHNPDLDNSEAEISIDVRSPFFETDYYFWRSDSDFNPKGALRDKFNKLCPGTDVNDGFFCNLAKFSPDPRLIKSHLPLSLLPQDSFTKAKIIYVARDPRDVIVSGYYYLKILKTANLKLTIDEFVDDFINDKAYGSYWEHMKLGWEKRNHSNVLFLYYEDLKADPKGQIKRVDQFLGTNRTDKQIDNVVFCTSFDYMKEKMKYSQPTSFDNEAFLKEEVEKGGGFFRKGKVGSWKEDLPLHLQEEINAWMDKNLAHFDEEFKYKSK